MSSIWSLPDFDAHEDIHIFQDRATGLKAVIAIHSTHLGPAAGGVRFWSYARDEDAVTDALRLSRGMSYKNAMAGLALGGGKGVILAGPDKIKSPELLHAFGQSIDRLGGRYVTAEDVGMSEADMTQIAARTRFVSGLPVGAGDAGGDPGPFTADGVHLGVKAAIKAGLGADSAKGVRVAIQGVGSVGGGLARRLAADGAVLTLADRDMDKARALAEELGATIAAAEDVLSLDVDVVSPNALGAILDVVSIPTIRAKIVAGGANNQFATAGDAARLHDRGILHAPDYVINAGGIINVGMVYLAPVTRADVMAKIAEIPGRLDAIWAESAATGAPPMVVADAMAQKLIGRA